MHERTLYARHNLPGTRGRDTRTDADGVADETDALATETQDESRGGN